MLKRFLLAGAVCQQLPFGNGCQPWHRLANVTFSRPAVVPVRSQVSRLWPGPHLAQFTPFPHGPLLRKLDMFHGVGLFSEQLPKCLLHMLWGFPGSGVPQQCPGHTTADFFLGTAVPCGSFAAVAVLELPTAYNSMPMVLSSPT